MKSKNIDNYLSLFCERYDWIYNRIFYFMEKIGNNTPHEIETAVPVVNNNAITDTFHF